MEFLHCRDCGETLRLLTFELVAGSDSAEETMLDRAAFGARHPGCGIGRWTPTGLAWSSLALREPMAERRIEVAGPGGRALAIGCRAEPDGPLAWRIERLRVAERLDIGLDRDTFFRVVHRAPAGAVAPARAAGAWAEAIEHWVRGIAPTEVVLLEDDARRPNVTAACLEPASRASLERWLRESDPEALGELLAAFDDPGFPPLAVTRSLVPCPSEAAAD